MNSRIGLSIVVMLGVGCGNTYDKIQGLSQRAADVSCDCFEEMGFESEQACRDEFEQEDDECIEQVYSDYKSELKETTDCMIPIMEEYVACIKDVEECAVASMVACVGGLEDIEACPAPPQEVQDAFGECSDPA